MHDSIVGVGVCRRQFGAARPCGEPTQAVPSPAQPCRMLNFPDNPAP
jgi:hypothetical protein